ncbi:hypothetical protein [Micromonospora sp. WMMD812]|uniref:hypothetical protein n=1 Tax=Micromonospora sp. WMMD812 TaxID=3015152 RepID=UPI00248B2CA5|nr:hypothetical protein [Micromonospora sp. WMMD812]WBB67972.1 hypothetical protein O7603_00910 [Micromonospora sp. WMMD812]
MRKLVSIVLTVAMLLATAACTGGPSTDPGDEDPYSEAALRYGQAPVPHPDVTFQPDVVLVGGGGRSIRSVTADGLTWRLDGKAKHADDLAVGKVMFVTGRGVGRVLHLEREGGDLLVTVGPVTLTEVIRDGTFEKKGVPLDNPVVYQAGEPSWANPEEADAAVTPSPTGRFGKSAPVRVAPAVPPPARPLQPPPTRNREVQTVAANFSTGVSFSDGAEISYHYDRDGLRLIGRVALTFTSPSADFHLDVRGGSLKRAELEITGGFGIRMSFQAAIQNGQNIRAVLPIPVEAAFPIGVVLGVPLTLTIGQTLKVTTAFGAKAGSINGSGEFSLAGKLGYGYANGTFGPKVTTNVQRKSSITKSLHGVPVGVMGLLVEHRVKFDVGFNAFVFKAGVYFELSTACGTTMGSALGAVATLGSHFVECRGVGLGVWARYGVGYSILQPVVNVINKFLNLINVKPINAENRLGPPPYRVWSKEEIDPPNTKICGTPQPSAD